MRVITPNTKSIIAKAIKPTVISGIKGMLEKMTNCIVNRKIIDMNGINKYLSTSMLEITSNIPKIIANKPAV